MKNLIVFFFMYFNMSEILLAQDVYQLYEKVPNSKTTTNFEIATTDHGILRISHVSKPTLTVYKPASSKYKSTAVLICPGGGYSILAAGHEGSEVARVLCQWGITAFVLKYRLPDEAIMIDKTIGPLQDVQRAIQLIRQNAAQWNIEPARIGVMGFSAGAHLAATAATHFNKPVIENPERISLRPDFSILIYPVISMTDSLTHLGSRNNLLGSKPSVELIKEFSNELQVTSETPPAFLVHAKDDPAVTVDNSIRYKEALERNNVQAEIWIYENGGHGFGMDNKSAKDNWMDKLKSWMINNHLL